MEHVRQPDARLRASEAEVPMKNICTALILLVSLVALAQDQSKDSSPVAVLGITQKFVQNDSADEVTIEYQNVSDKEISVGVFEITRVDKLDRVTDVTTLEPMTLHESGHRTLRPGKKNKVTVGPFLLHANDRARIRVTIVKFTDGTKWEAVKP
jgi:hypothetical protein